MEPAASLGQSEGAGPNGGPSAGTGAGTGEGPGAGPGDDRVDALLRELFGPDSAVLAARRLPRRLAALKERTMALTEDIYAASADLALMRKWAREVLQVVVVRLDRLAVTRTSVSLVKLTQAIHLYRPPLPLPFPPAPPPAGARL